MSAAERALERADLIAALTREIARQWALAGRSQPPADAAYHAAQARALSAMRAKHEAAL